MWLHNPESPAYHSTDWMVLRNKDNRMSEDKAEELRVEQVGAVTLVTLNRPKALNALTAAMRAGFSEMLWPARATPTSMPSSCNRRASALFLSAPTCARSLAGAAPIRRARWRRSRRSTRSTGNASVSRSRPSR